MSNELAVLKSKLADNERQLRELTIIADNLIINVRESLNVYVDFLELPLEGTLQDMKELHSTWQKAKKIKALITKMKKDLGIEDDES